MSQSPEVGEPQSWRSVPFCQASLAARHGQREGDSLRVRGGGHGCSSLGMKGLTPPHLTPGHQNLPWPWTCSKAYAPQPLRGPGKVKGSSSCWIMEPKVAECQCTMEESGEQRFCEWASAPRPTLLSVPLISLDLPDTRLQSPESAPGPLTNTCLSNAPGCPGGGAWPWARRWAWGGCPSVLSAHQVPLVSHRNLSGHSPPTFR